MPSACRRVRAQAGPTLASSSRTTSLAAAKWRPARPAPAGKRDSRKRSTLTQSGWQRLLRSSQDEDVVAQRVQLPSVLHLLLSISTALPHRVPFETAHPDSSPDTSSRRGRAPLAMPAAHG